MVDFGSLTCSPGAQLCWGAFTARFGFLLSLETKRNKTSYIHYYKRSVLFLLKINDDIHVYNSFGSLLILQMVTSLYAWIPAIASYENLFFACWIFYIITVAVALFTWLFSFFFYQTGTDQNILQHKFSINVQIESLKSELDGV